MEQAHSPNYEKAVAADRRLRAVLPNPKYAYTDKVSDLSAQRELLASLTEEETKTLKYGVAQIEEWLQTHPQE